MMRSLQKKTGGALVLGLGCLFVVLEGTAQLPEVAIPRQEEWKEQGVALENGSHDAWDRRLYGQISPCAAIRSDDQYLLYYVGAAGDRTTDGGPRARALGVAVSQNGLRFKKASANPILTHQPHGNQEEGIFSAGVVNEKEGIQLYYGAIWARNATTESVHSSVALARSSDGIRFHDKGAVVRWDDPRVWGHGDEIFPLGVFKAGNRWHVYYGAKSGNVSWGLGITSGPKAITNSKTRPVLTEGQIIGGCNPVRIGGGKIALFIVRDFDRNKIEVRTASIDRPGQLSSPLREYSSFPPGCRHTAVLLDREEERWLMYQATDRSNDGNQVFVRTAPLRFSEGKGPEPGK